VVAILFFQLLRQLVAVAVPHTIQPPLSLAVPVVAVVFVRVLEVALLEVRHLRQDKEMLVEMAFGVLLQQMLRVAVVVRVVLAPALHTPEQQT